MQNISKFLFVAILAFSVAKADIHTDIAALNSETATLNTQLSNFTMTQEGACMDLGAVNRTIENLSVMIENITSAMSVFSVTTADLDAMDSISNIIKNISLESIRLSSELTMIQTMTDLFEYKAGLDAVLQLSTDIGTMADRILEMADRILIMADNIGTMASRILITQQIQSTNLALTQASILTTQENMVALSNSFSSIAYNLSLGLIISDDNALLNQMSGVTLTSSNMSSELDTLAASTSSTLTKVTDLLLWMTNESSKASHYINSDTLTMLGDLSTIHKALSSALEVYANTINALAPVTDSVVLTDATATMFVLTKEIQTMSNRIMEMADKIFIMADNIGLMADNIVATQNLQASNLTLTQNSMITTQNLIITVIKNFGL